MLCKVPPGITPRSQIQLEVAGKQNLCLFNISACRLHFDVQKQKEKAAAESLWCLSLDCLHLFVRSIDWFKKVSGAVLDWMNQTLSLSEMTGSECPHFSLTATICINFVMKLWGERKMPANRAGQIHLSPL